MTRAELLGRTRRFALDVLRYCLALPPAQPWRVVANQLARSASSIGANYRAACRARSRRDFVAKIGVVEEEADESAYWLELVLELGVPQPAEVRRLLRERTNSCASLLRRARPHGAAAPGRS